MKKSVLTGACMSLFLAAVLLAQAPALSTQSAGQFDAVAPKMQEFVDKGEISGVVTLVATRDRVLHLAAVGRTDMATERRMRTDDIFWIASMTKPITAVCLGILVDDGRITFDDPVGNYLREFRDLTIAENGEQVRPSRAITLRDMLAHTSGLGELNRREPHLTLEQTATQLAQLPLRFQPGTRWGYSTAALDVLGRVVEVVSGMTFDAFLQARVLNPLGMNDTSFWISAEKKERWARSYQWVAPESTLRETTISYMYSTDVTDRRRPPLGGAGLFSTAEDIARFYQMMLNGGQLNGRRVLKPQTVAEMLRKQTGDLPARPGMPWGLGFSVVQDPRAMDANKVLSPGSFGHGGAYSTQSWADPTRNLIWVLMFQRNGKGNPDNSDVRIAFQEAVTSTRLAGMALQAPPRYELTDHDRQALRTKLDELDPLVRALKARRGEDDLLADVEIHAKAGHWLLEFPQDITVQDDVTFALKMVDRGIERAKQLQSGQSPWASQKGKVALGFYSPLDGSVQPLLLTVPASYDGTRPTRLDIVLHGRSQRLIESNWICYDPSPANAQTAERLFTHTQGSCLAPTPNPASNGVWNAGQFQLEVFARGNNANHWAGEVDVFESTAAVQRRFKIDNSRLVLRGFSLGGAGAWHLALHHPDRWVAAEIGAGTWPRRYIMMDEFPPHQRPTLRIWENMTEWALNAFNLPIAGHDGDSDTQVASIPRPPEGEPTRGQLESSIRIREQLAKEGFPSEGEPNDYVAKGTPSIFLISEKTGHSTSPKVRQRLDGFLKEWTDRGLQSPDHIRFLTYTTRYNKSFWVTIDGLGKHYERAEVDARRLSGGGSYQIKTTNVSRLVLRETERASEIQIDGQTLRVKPGRELAFEKSVSGWRPAPSGKWAGLHKTHGLQGPIDDAFLDPFLLVRPTGTPWNPAAHQHALKRLERFDQAYARFYRAHPRIKNDTDVSESDFSKYHVVLFGDPGSNRWIGRLNGKLPVRWSKGTITVGGKEFAAASHLPVLVYPNPLAPSRYVVLNSGLTIAENSYTSDYSMPTLGDIAVLQVQADADTATVPFAGFFDESWSLR